VAIVDDTTLLIPERPGNGLAYGLAHLIDNPHIGIVFVIPGSTETFRVDGTVELTRDPELLRRVHSLVRGGFVACRVLSRLAVASKQGQAVRRRASGSASRGPVRALYEVCDARLLLD